MPHPRKAIRDFVVAALEALPELTTVEASRLRDWQVEQLPAAAVYTPREPTQRLNIAGDLQRDLELVIAASFSIPPETSLDDAADDLAEAIEAAMSADPTLGRTALDSWLALTEIGLTGEGERRVGLLSLTYTVRYLTP